MLEMLSIVDLRFLLMVLLGSVAGLFVGAIPGLSVIPWLQRCLFLLLIPGIILTLWL